MTDHLKSKPPGDDNSHNNGQSKWGVRLVWKLHRVLTWVIAITITLAAFYVMDHLVMGMQGLPLDWDLSPAQ